ncbi:MAG: hypothetical protein J6A69_04200 [Clostridia bacterium]|nr:hypothetical protein [Clostridia bacterium]
MSKEYLSECISDLLKHYNERNFIEMAFAYDEVQICKGLKLAADKTFFTEILDGNKMIVPQSLLKTIEYDGEPILVSVQKKWNQVSFDTMYEGVTLKDIPMPDDVATPIELIKIASDREIILNEKCVNVLNVKQGDIVLILAMSEGFYVTKFTEKDIKDFM